MPTISLVPINGDGCCVSLFGDNYVILEVTLNLLNVERSKYSTLSRLCGTTQRWKV